MATIESVQSGTETIVAADGVVINVSISSVVTDQSFVVMTIITTAGAERELRHKFTSDLTSSTNLQFVRDESNFAGTVTLNWQVFEFDSSVTVSRYSDVISADPTNVTITAVAGLTETFLITSWETTVNQSTRFTATLTSTTNVDYDFDLTPDTKTINLQVIEFNSSDISVEHVSFTFTASVFSETDVISSVNTSNTFIAHNGTRAALSFDENVRNRSRINLDSSTQVTLVRNDANTSSRSVSYSVVEMLDGSTVEQGLETITDGNTTPTTQPSFTALSSNSGFFEANIDGNQTIATNVGGIDENDVTAGYFLDGTLDGVTISRNGTVGDLEVNWTVVEWNAAAAVTVVLTGTMIATVDEDDITTGGKTIIITLTGDTFKAAGTGPIGSTADTQALIDGFDAATSPTNGWNNEVRDKALTSEIVRTSSTVATWTVAAQAGYDISAQEVITGTIPTDVLVTGAGAVTATPTFTIDAVAAGSLLLMNRSIANYGGTRQ